MIFVGGNPSTRKTLRENVFPANHLAEY